MISSFGNSNLSERDMLQKDSIIISNLNHINENKSLCGNDQKNVHANEIWQQSRIILTEKMGLPLNAEKIGGYLQQLTNHWIFQQKYNHNNKSIAIEIMKLFFFGVNLFSENESQWMVLIEQVDSTIIVLNNSNSEIAYQAVQQLLLFKAEKYLECGLLSKADSVLMKVNSKIEQDLSKFCELKSQILLAIGDLDGAETIRKGIRNQLNHDGLLWKIKKHIILKELDQANYLIELSMKELIDLIIAQNTNKESIDGRGLQGDTLSLNSRNPSTFLMKLTSLSMQVGIQRADPQQVKSAFQKAQEVHNILKNKSSLVYVECICNFIEGKMNNLTKNKLEQQLETLNLAISHSKATLHQYLNMSTYVARIYDLKARILTKLSEFAPERSIENKSANITQLLSKKIIESTIKSIKENEIFYQRSSNHQQFINFL